MAVTNSDTQFGKLEKRTEEVFCGPLASLGLVLHPYR